VRSRSAWDFASFTIAVKFSLLDASPAFTNQDDRIVDAKKEKT
jgi:hypothetical protein